MYMKLIKYKQTNVISKYLRKINCISFKNKYSHKTMEWAFLFDKYAYTVLDRNILRSKIIIKK